MTGEVASGVIWWGRRAGLLDMLPVVHVRDAHTTCIENACGSGALALALLLAAKGNRKPLDIMQPGGSSLHVHIPDDDQGKAFIDLYYETYDESVASAVIPVTVYLLDEETAAKYKEQNDAILEADTVVGR